MHSTGMRVREGKSRFPPSWEKNNNVLYFTGIVKYDSTSHVGMIPKKHGSSNGCIMRYTVDAEIFVVFKFLWVPSTTKIKRTKILPPQIIHT